jgi:hypothetical protein
MHLSIVQFWYFYGLYSASTVWPAIDNMISQKYFLPYTTPCFENAANLPAMILGLPQDSRGRWTTQYLQRLPMGGSTIECPFKYLD